MRDDAKHATEGRATKQLVLPTSEATDDTHLTMKEELTDTNTKAIERMKTGSNKMCIQEDLAKEKMAFSKESRQAIFNMGNVELIELKKTTIQCPSCLHNVFEGTFLRNRGKLSKFDPDAINRIMEAFEILKAPFRTSPISTSGANVGRIHGNGITTKLVTHFEALQKASEVLRQYGIDGKMMRLAGNLSLSIIGRMLGLDAWIILYNSVSTTMRRINNEKEMLHVLYLRSVDDKTTGTACIARTTALGSERAIKKFTQGEKRTISSSCPCE